MDKFTQYNINLSEKNKDLVKKYLQDIKKFVDKYNIEKELYTDIEEMVFEKLSNAKTLNQLAVTKIIKEVWEPEVIFSEYIVETIPKKEEKKKKNVNSQKNKLLDDSDPRTKHEDDNSEWQEEEKIFYENMIEKWWERDNKDAIIYWLSPMIAKKASLPTWMIRALFVLFAFAWWIWIYAYLILWFILPIKWIDYKWKSLSQYFKTQLYYAIKDFFTNIVKSLRKFIRRSFNLIVSFLKYILNFIMKNILPILRFLIFVIIGFCLFSIFIAVLFVWALYFSSFTFDNIDFTYILPSYTMAWIITWIYSIWIFMVASFVFAVNWKWLNKYIIASSFVSLIVAIFLAFSWTFHLINLYSKENIYVQNIEIEMEETDNKDINLDVLDVVGRDNVLSFIGFDSITSVTLVNEKSGVLKAEIKYLFTWNDEIAKKIETSISQSKFVKKDNSIAIEQKNLFTQKVPPVPFRKDITLYVPEGYTIRFSNYNSRFFRIKNAYFSWNYEKYYDSIGTNCNDKTIWYSVEEERFICMLGEAELREARKEYLKKYIVENFDTFSPIHHVNEYKRNYWYNDSRISSDWNFSNLYWIDDETLNVEFWDMSLDIRATLKIKEVENEVEVSDFKITYVRVEDYVFKEKYYVDITPIKDFLWSRYQDEYNHNTNDNYYEDNFEQDVMNEINEIESEIDIQEEEMNYSTECDEFWNCERILFN